MQDKAFLPGGFVLCLAPSALAGVFSCPAFGSVGPEAFGAERPCGAILPAALRLRVPSAHDGRGRPRRPKALVTPEISGGFTSSPSGLATGVPGRRAAGPEPPGPGSLVAAAPRCRAAAVPV